MYVAATTGARYYQYVLGVPNIYEPVTFDIKEENNQPEIISSNFAGANSRLLNCLLMRGLS